MWAVWPASCQAARTPVELIESDVTEFPSVFPAVTTKDNPEGNAVLAHWGFEFVSSTTVVPVNHNTGLHDFYPAVVAVSTSKPDTVVSYLTPSKPSRP